MPFKEIKDRISETSLGDRYIHDVKFRTEVSVKASLLVNLFYIIINVFSYFIYHSMWFVVLAAYYSILVIMRSLIANYIRVKGIGNCRLGELRRAKLCAYILLTVNIALSGAVLMIMLTGAGVSVTVITLSIYMIVHTNSEIRRIKNGKQRHV